MSRGQVETERGELEEVLVVGKITELHFTPESCRKANLAMMLNMFFTSISSTHDKYTSALSLTNRICSSRKSSLMIVHPDSLYLNIALPFGSHVGQCGKFFKP